MALVDRSGIARPVRLDMQGRSHPAGHRWAIVAVPTRPQPAGRRQSLPWSGPATAKSRTVCKQGVVGSSPIVSTTRDHGIDRVGAPYRQLPPTTHGAQENRTERQLCGGFEVAPNQIAQVAVHLLVFRRLRVEAELQREAR